MTTVLLTAFSFMLIILIGAYLHMGGILPENAGDVVKRILINVTLPCAIIVNFSKIEVVGAEMLALTVLGIAANVIMIAVGIVITKKEKQGGKGAAYTVPPRIQHRSVLSSVCTEFSSCDGKCGGLHV